MAVKGLANMAQLGLANAVKSDYAKSKFKKTANKYLDQALDAFVNDMSKKIRGGSGVADYNAYDVNQVLPMSMYAPDGVNDPTNPLYEGGAFDIHKAIGKLPKPKSGWTLPGHKYTGPYNDLDSQLRFDPKTGEILEIYDPPAGPSDAVAMQHDVDYSVCANKANPKKCKNEADRWEASLADELHKPIRRNFPKRRVIVNGIDEIWCSDLVEMQKFAKWNKGYRYLLMVLDIFSKYGWIIPLKNKKGESVAAGFKQIFAEGRVPKKMWTDKGSEYYNQSVKDLFKAKGVELYSTENEEKSSVCERWNRTIKTKMWKQFTIQNNTVYLDILPKILEKYNNTKHRSIGMTPVEASKKKNENAVYLKLYGKQLKTSGLSTYPPKFAVGDHVRISKFKRQLFDTGYTPNWSEEIFVVDEVQYTEPITYKLKDLLGEEIKGTFYEQEMLKAKQSLSGLFRIEKTMERITLAQLRQIAKENGLRTYLELLPYITGVQRMKFMTVVQLRGFAKKRRLRGYSDLRKDELIKIINDAGITDEECAKEVGYKKKIFADHLYLYARDLGLRGYSRLRKDDLIEFIKDERCITTDEEWEEEIKRMSEMLARNVVNAFGYTLDEIVDVIHICIMERHTVEQLRKLAKKSGLHGYANIRKDELIKRIKLAQSKPKSPPLPIIIRKKAKTSAPATITEFRELAKKQGLRGRDYKKRLHEFIQSKKPQGSSTTPRGPKAALKKRDPRKPLFKAVEKMSSLKHFAKMYTIDGGPIALGPRDYLEIVKPTVINFLNMLKSNKIKFIFRCVMVKKVGDEFVFTIAHLSTLQKIVFQETDREELYKECVEKMIKSLEKFERSGSGWRFYQVEGLDLHTVKYTPLKGSSYIKLPKHLADKKAIINMENEDDQCFKWCVTRALNPVQSNPTRITKILKKQAEKLVWGDIKFPMEVKGIDRFEKLNPEIGVNVYMYENGLNPLRVSSKGQGQGLIDLLLIQDGDKKHYCLIKNLSRLVSMHKLTCTLNEKKKYIIHHKALKKYMSLGIEIGKIHRIIRFKESPWMKKYINKNTKLRAKAKNDFEKDFYKLMNNAVFGKTMENIRKRVDVRLVTSDEKAKKLTNKVNFKHCTIFSEDLSAIHMGKTQILFNKPLYLGMSILDISKTLMYDFHYNYIKPKYPEGKSKLLFTDTDSLCYEIQTEDFYKDISDDVDRLFDTSNIKKGHPSGIPTGVNKKVIGMFKDEKGGKIIEEFVGLRAKLYSYKMFGDEEEVKKCKGMKEGVVDRTINFDDYKRCLFGGGKQLRKMNTLRSRKHEMYMEEINKVALSADDDKRIILPDKIHTYAIGHHKAVTQHT
ncbi:putative uncharacterized transposon-derived protein F54H12.3 [Stylophora pistillata]|uniref:Uncharacterized transposon-derived protein F54H12.3 n=1 Tax=Stylophora pistillata TaxID=50429 RepID=A0A2B4RK78_STYPI|nr:putative uncharacterized transposon-derived protein F54H12.3 [Stylophora pistillata]